MNNVLFFDIETVPQPGREPENRKLVRDKILSYAPDTHNLDQVVEATLGTQPEMLQIVGMNLAFDEGSIHSGWVGDKDTNGEEITEVRLLKHFWTMAKKAHTLVGFNCLWFDIPAILTRSAVLEVQPSLNLFDLKPWENQVIDLYKKRWPGGQKYQIGSLKSLISLLNLPLPSDLQLDMDGGNVRLLWEAGDLDTLKLYGQMDIFATRELCRLWGGVFFPQLLTKWDGYDYQTGEWAGDAPW